MFKLFTYTLYTGIIKLCIYLVTHGLMNRNEGLYFLMFFLLYECPYRC